MAHAVAEIERTTGERIDLDDQEQVPFDDEATYAMIRTTRTAGQAAARAAGARRAPAGLQPVATGGRAHHLLGRTGLKGARDHIGRHARWQTTRPALVLGCYAV